MSYWKWRKNSLIYTGWLGMPHSTGVLRQTSILKSYKSDITQSTGFSVITALLGMTFQPTPNDRSSRPPAEVDVRMDASRLRARLIAGAVWAMLSLVPFVANSQTKALEEPLVISTELPSYPPLARASCTQGSVAIVVQIDEQGQVTSTDVLYGHILLRSAAEAAARKWRFKATTAAEGVAQREVLRFMFRILPFETPSKRLKAIFTRSTDVEIRSHPYEPSCDDCSPRRLKDLRKGGCPMRST